MFATRVGVEVDSGLVVLFVAVAKDQLAAREGSAFRAFLRVVAEVLLLVGSSLRRGGAKKSIAEARMGCDFGSVCLLIPLCVMKSYRLLTGVCFYGGIFLLEHSAQRFPMATSSFNSNLPVPKTSFSLIMLDSVTKPSDMSTFNLG